MTRAARAVALALVLGGCRGRTAPPVARDAAPSSSPAPEAARHETIRLTRVAIQRLDPAAPREIYDQELGQALGQRLVASAPFAGQDEAVPPTERVRRARVEVVVTYDVVGAEPARSIVATAEARVVWEDGSDRVAPRDSVASEQAVGPAQARALDGAVAALVARTVDQAGQGLVAKAALRNAGDAELVAALADADPDRVLWALALVGERKLAGAVDAAIGLLGSANPELADAAVGALVAIGDRRAVAAMTRDVDFRDHARLRMIIEAASALGGDEARAFLELIAGGHPDADLRARASEALERMARHEPAP